MIKPDDLPDASEYILTGSIKENRLEQLGINLEASEDLRTIHKSIKSSCNSRERFYEQQNKKYNKKRSAL